MLMKRWEKMESCTGSSWGPMGRGATDPTAMEMSPKWVMLAVQPGSTTMVLWEAEGQRLPWVPTSSLGFS